MSVFLAGGGFKPGYVHGATDKLGGEPIDGKCTPADLSATILNQLGIDPTAKLTAPSGREMPVIRNGQVIKELA
jgi:hypothetical protein